MRLLPADGPDRLALCGVALIAAGSGIMWGPGPSALVVGVLVLAAAVVKELRP